MTCKYPNLAASTAYIHKGCRCSRCKAYLKQHNDKHKEYMREFYQTPGRKEYARKATRISTLKHKYGLTPECYDEMLLEQEQLCKICRRHKSEFKRKLHVDHCHTTGTIRGLLCPNCNSGIGKLNDDPKLLQAAIDYLTCSDN